MSVDKFNLRNFRNIMFDKNTPYFEEQKVQNEYIYVHELTFNNQKIDIKVYSTVDTRSKKARKSGRDSIKVLFKTKMKT